MPLQLMNGAFLNMCRSIHFSQRSFKQLTTTFMPLFFYTLVNRIEKMGSLEPPPDGNQNRTGAMVGAIIAFTTAAGVFVGLRVYTRLFLNKSARWDDWTIVIAFVRVLLLLVLKRTC